MEQRQPKACFAAALMLAAAPVGKQKDAGRHLSLAGRNVVFVWTDVLTPLRCICTRLFVYLVAGPILGVDGGRHTAQQHCKRRHEILQRHIVAVSAMLALLLALPAPTQRLRVRAGKHSSPTADLHISHCRLMCTTQFS